jgi:hypothetical protein
LRYCSATALNSILMSRFMVILQIVFFLSTARRASRFFRKAFPNAPHWTHPGTTYRCWSPTQSCSKSSWHPELFLPGNFCETVLVLHAMGASSGFFDPNLSPIKCPYD